MNVVTVANSDPLLKANTEEIQRPYTGRILTVQAQMFSIDLHFPRG